MSIDEMLKHKLQCEHMFFVAPLFRNFNIFKDKAPNFRDSRCLIMNQKVTQLCGHDIRNVLMLRNGIHFFFGQVTEPHAIFI